MRLIRVCAGLLLVAAGAGGAAEVSGYLRTASHFWVSVVVYAGLVVLVRLAVPEGVSAGPYLIGALGTVTLLLEGGVVGWERVPSVAPGALVAGGVAVVLAAAVGRRAAPTRERPV